MLKKLLITMVLISASFAASADRKSVAIVEILFLNPGKTTEQAELYFAKAHEVAKRYGAKPIAGMHLSKWLRGGNNRIYEADYIVGSEFPTQSAMNKMLRNDKDYDGLLLERDTIFNSEQNITFAVTPLSAE